VTKGGGQVSEALVEATTVRRAASLFSTRNFRPILAHGSSQHLEQHVARLRNDLGLARRANNGAVVDAAYELLARSYRSEYVYKNLIASKVFVGRHRAANSVLINEFAVGSAVADSLMVNGRATAYEIKTELDNPDKLARQLVEYYRAVPLVNVVVHESVASRYATELRDTPAGLISVGKRWRLSSVKAAEESQQGLCVRTMFNTLRVSEVQTALVELGFQLPNVPNGRRYEEQLNLAMQVAPAVFHRVWIAAIKRRRLRGDVALYRDPRLFALRALLVQLNPTHPEGNNLLRWLSTGE
jgi:hypothetical protein